jgi:hypothetical protein
MCGSDTDMVRMLFETASCDNVNMLNFVASTNAMFDSATTNNDKNEMTNSVTVNNELVNSATAIVHNEAGPVNTNSQAGDDDILDWTQEEYDSKMAQVDGYTTLLYQCLLGLDHYVTHLGPANSDLIHQTHVL